MKTNAPSPRHTSSRLITSLVFLIQLSAAFAQLPSEVGRLGYADTVFVNGKVVSMDDASNSTSMGHIYQAIAVKGDRIMKLGPNDDLTNLIGPDTKVLDLKGRTLIPGIIETHTHLYGMVSRYMDRLGFKFPPKGIIVEEQADLSLEKTQVLMRDAIQQAVKKVQPGEWVVLKINGHPEAPNEVEFWGFTRRLTNRKTLDLWGTRESCFS